MQPFVAGKRACELWPTSKTTASLVEPFQSNVEAFITCLEREHGCVVKINATRRPEPRAWLMRYAWDIARRGLPLSKVPVREDIPITWSVAGAKAMVLEYGLVVRPSLVSRHIEGRAIDMEIEGWAHGDDALYALGETFGVWKLRSDRPHWSDDGH